MTGLGLVRTFSHGVVRLAWRHGSGGLATDGWPTQPTHGGGGGGRGGLGGGGFGGLAAQLSAGTCRRDLAS